MEEIFKFEEDGWKRKEHVWKEKEQTWRAKQEALERKITELARNLQEEKNQKRKEETNATSKVTIRSANENDLSTLRASLVKHQHHNKENLTRNHPSSSLPKRPLKELDWDENRLTRKLNESVTNHPAYQRMERNKWRYY